MPMIGFSKNDFIKILEKAEEEVVKDIEYMDDEPMLKIMIMISLKMMIVKTVDIIENHIQDEIDNKVEIVS